LTLQELVVEFIKKYNLRASEQIRYIDLTTEIGELGKEIIKGSDYGKKNYEQTVCAKDELGDCLFSLLALCCEMNIDAKEALQQAMEKYEVRFAQKGDIGSGL
jgi:NTP pyrophosphatase (non-canonical NTP hydrolase)